MGDGMIILNRPERLNAINGDLLRDFVKQLNVAREDKKAVSVILTGTGRSFCAGEDLKETSAGKSFDTWIEETNGLQDIQRLILRLDKPLIAAVQGYALGGGCEFAMSCDIRIAAENAVFGFPETGVGLTVTTAGTKLIPFAGLGKANWSLRANSLARLKPPDWFGQQGCSRRTPSGGVSEDGTKNR
jgi:enoyl-CoA hydratase/carnithine racemase